VGLPKVKLVYFKIRPEQNNPYAQGQWYNASAAVPSGFANEVYNPNLVSAATEPLARFSRF
jgi:hypothetical protein